MTVDIVTEINQIENLHHDWSLLLKTARLNNLFLTWEWIYSWCQNMQNPPETPFILTAREGRKLVGLAPLVSVEGENLKTFIKFLGQKYSYHLGFIAEKGCEEEVYKAFWDHLIDGIGNDFTAVEFLHLEEDAVFESILKTQAGKRGLGIEKSVQNTCKVLDLPGSYEDFLKPGILPYKFRQNLIRECRRLTKECHVEFFHSELTHFQKYWSELLNFHRQMMQQKNKHSVLMGNPFPQHLQQVAEAFHKQQALRLSVLEVNHETAAVLLGIIYNGVYNALTIGVNHQLIRKMPWFNFTFQTLIHGIKTAIESGCKEFDFLGGHHDYKYKMGGKDKAGIKISVFCPVTPSQQEESRLSLQSELKVSSKLKNILRSIWILSKKKAAKKKC